MNIPEPILRIISVLLLLAPFLEALLGVNIVPVIDLTQMGIEVILAAISQISVIVIQIVSYIRDWRRAAVRNVSFKAYNLMNKEARLAVYAFPE